MIAEVHTHLSGRACLSSFLHNMLISIAKITQWVCLLPLKYFGTILLTKQ
jgi:hypothetical protein